MRSFPSISLSRPVIFLADIHLGKSPRAAERLTALFARMPGETAIAAVGDIVDYWVEGRTFDLAGYFEAAAGFRGFECYFLEGNRDFLIGPRWENLTGGKAIGDLAAFDCWGRNFLCTHGDLLVARDTRYRAWRMIARSSLFRLAASHFGERLALRTAENLSRQSAAEVARKSPRTLELSVSAASRMLHGSGAEKLICGHTHRPCRVRLDCGELIVLGAWDEGAEVYYVGDGREYYGPVDDLCF